MGFDQYHEPPDELPVATRTFARLCASLTRRPRRSAGTSSVSRLEADPEARRDHARTRKERSSSTSHGPRVPASRTPRWRDIAQGILFQPGDIVEHGEEAERAAPRASRRRGRASGSLGIGGLKGGGAMNHLLRGARADHRRGWRARRRRGARAARPRHSRRASSSTSRARTAGSTRRRTSGAHRAPAAGDGVSRAGAGAPARRAARDFTVRHAELATSIAAPRRRPDELDEARARIAIAENIAVFHGWVAAGSAASPSVCPRRVAARRDPQGFPRHGGRAVERSCRSASRSRTASRSAAASTHVSSRRPSTAATRSSTTSARSSTGPIVWAPGVEGAVVLSLRGGDFLFESGQDLVDRLRPPRQRSRSPLHRRELHLCRGKRPTLRLR
jgi:hypothetical protein